MREAAALRMPGIAETLDHPPSDQVVQRLNVPSSKSLLLMPSCTSPGSFYADRNRHRVFKDLRAGAEYGFCQVLEYVGAAHVRERALRAFRLNVLARGTPTTCDLSYYRHFAFSGTAPAACLSSRPCVWMRHTSVFT